MMSQGRDEAKHRGIAARETARPLFRLLTIPSDATIKEDKQKLIEKEAKDWLLEYKRAYDTPEGQGVRFELAKSLFQQARHIESEPKRPRERRALLRCGQEALHRTGR